MDTGKIKGVKLGQTARSSNGPVPNANGQAAARIGAERETGAAEVRDGRGVDASGLSDTDVQKSSNRFAWAGESRSAPFEEVKFGKAATTRSFGDRKLQIAAERGVEEKAMGDNRDITFQWRQDALKDKDGKTLYSGPDLKELRGDFMNEANDNWKFESRLRPAGAVGPYVSVAVDEQSYTGGASPNQDSRLMTIDSRTGKQVTLQSLVSAEQFQEVVDKVLDVQGYVPAAENYAAGESHIRDHANRSFALFDQAGQTRLAVAIPSSTETADGTVAEYTFQLPDFRK